MHAVPKKPRLRDVAQKDRLRMTPVAKKVLQEASQPNRRKLYVTAQQVLAQILALQPPDPAAVLLGALGVNTSEVRRRLDAVTPEAESPATFTTSSEAALIGPFPAVCRCKHLVPCADYRGSTDIHPWHFRSRVMRRHSSTAFDSFRCPTLTAQLQVGHAGGGDMRNGQDLWMRF